MDTTAVPHARARRWTPFLLILVGLAACGPGAGTTAGTSVSLAPNSLQLTVGATATLEATVHGTADQAVTWTSADDAVAAVADDGTVTGVAAGTTSITATSDHDPTRSASAAVTVSSAGPAPLDWTVQFGTTEMDRGQAIAVDADGFVVVVGATAGDLDGSNVGDLDAFVAKYAPDGEEVWVRQFGTNDWDEALAVAIDAEGNILVAGATRGELAGPIAGNFDVFVRQYAPDGDVMWTEQFGTAQSDRAFAIAVDGNGDVIVAGQGVGEADGPDGYGTNGFVRKFNRVSGGGLAEEWTFVPQSQPEGIAVDTAGNVVAVGQLWVEGVGSELYVVKLTPDGTETWTGLFGTGTKFDFLDAERDPVPDTRWPTELWEGLRGYEEVGKAVAVDPAGNLFVTGSMGGFNTGTGIAYERAFVLRLTPGGEEVWAVLFDDTYATYGNAIAIDADGTLLVTGNTASYYWERSPIGTEMFVRALAPNGTLLWDDTYGDSGWDTSYGVALDAEGNVYNAGFTLEELGGPNLGESDVFLRRYGP